MKPPIDPATAFSLQEKYLETRSDRDLNALLIELQNIAKEVLRAMLYKKGVHLSEERVQDLVIDAPACIISRYLKSNDYRVHTSFFSVVYLQLFRSVFGKEQQHRDALYSDDDVEDLQVPYEEPELDEGVFDRYPKGRTALQVLIHDEEHGADIAKDLYFATNKPDAYVAISKYKGERWVIDNVDLLAHIYKRLRKPKGERDGQRIS